jgi:hypothetical protein
MGSHNRALKKGEKAGREPSRVYCPRRARGSTLWSPSGFTASARVVEPDGLLTAYALAARVCAGFDRPWGTPVLGRHRGKLSRLNIPMKPE